ncbi:hypothetical protein JHK82_043270 [Glycine max]|nr:hypothetical protein JHK82_043270 [Glycine max]
MTLRQVLHGISNATMLGFVYGILGNYLVVGGLNFFVAIVNFRLYLRIRFVIGYIPRFI